MKPVRSILMPLTVLLALAIVTSTAEESLAPTVNDIMTAIITPATDIIWGIEDPQTDEEWQVFIDAAKEVEDAAREIKAGAGGPNDADWAKDPQWRQFADVLIESAQEIQEAASRHDLDTLIDISSNKMYPPCEECHLMFHPAMQEQEVN